MFQGKVEIISRGELAPHFFLFSFSAPEVAREARSGQFVHIRCGEGANPLLRRPFSISRMERTRGEIEILFRVVGKGTKILSEKGVGEDIDIMGPLGNGFSLPDREGCLILVGGGTGIAPLPALAEEAKKHRLVVLLGAKSKEFLLAEDSFRSLGAEVEVATEDGSAGYKGLVSDLLSSRLVSVEGHQPFLYACGPSAMLKKVAKISLEHQLPCQVLLENQMGCGVGACLGCVIRTRDGYRRVCKDGPVFHAADVIWDNGTRIFADTRR